MKRATVILFALNVLVLMFIGICYVIPVGRMMRRDRLVADTTGMTVAVKQPPFTIFQDKQYPQRKSFRVEVQSMPLTFTCRDYGRGEITANIDVREHGMVTPVCSLSVAFAFTNGVAIRHTTLVRNTDTNGVSIRNAILARRSGLFVDRGADGSYDEVRALSGVPAGSR